MNKLLLRKVRAVLLENRDKFNYSVCSSKLYPSRPCSTSDLLSNNPECETVGCIAGWTCAISNISTSYTNKILDAAQELLGLTCSQADFLFLGYSYGPFRHKYTSSMSLSDAIERIDWLLNGHEQKE